MLVNLIFVLASSLGGTSPILRGVARAPRAVLIGHCVLLPCRLVKRRAEYAAVEAGVVLLAAHRHICRDGRVVRRALYRRAAGAAASEQT